jgi:predicted metal-dependent phosphoesterase TrpH
VRIDLHTHSSASDGTDTPAELVAHAARTGVDVLAITDHDTTAGWDAAEAALPDGLTLVPGMELSCAYFGPDGKISIHLLAYLFDPEHPGLREERQRLRGDRLTRGRRIVDNLAADGVPISWHQVEQIADGAAVGRPHIGRALVASGLVDDVTDAFEKYLSSSSKYYVRKADTDVFDAIRLVRQAGGVPVFAHPLARRRGRVVDDAVIRAMAGAGLLGLEVAHPDHDPADQEHLADLASTLGLLTTGSSDYHGTNKRTPMAVCVSTGDQYERLLAQDTALRPLRR